MATAWYGALPIGSWRTHVISRVLLRVLHQIRSFMMAIPYRAFIVARYRHQTVDSSGSGRGPPGASAQRPFCCSNKQSRTPIKSRADALLLASNILLRRYIRFLPDIRPFLRSWLGFTRGAEKTLFSVPKLGQSFVIQRCLEVSEP